MSRPLAQVSFEITLKERVDFAVRANRWLFGRFLWGVAAGASLLGCLAVVVVASVFDHEPAASAWAAGGITLAILVVLLPPIVILLPRITSRAVLRRSPGGWPRPATVTLNAEEISTSDPNVRVSLSWGRVERIDLEQDHIVFAGHGVMIFLPNRAFPDAAERSAFLEIAKHKVAEAAAAARDGGGRVLSG